MPKKYRFSTPDSVSDYEDDDGNVYVVAALLGQGKYARARRLLPKKEGVPLVVLDPVDINEIDANECMRKFKFFSTHHAPCRPLHFKKEGSNEYRLILPLLSGEPYQQLVNVNGKIKDFEQQITLFLSLIKELQQLHAKRLVYLDLKIENVLYDKASGQSKLIDGGLTVTQDEELPAVFHISQAALQKCCRASFHIAPECWITPSTAFIPSPEPSMDIYSLGVLMLEQLCHEDMDPGLFALANSCRATDPGRRPTLESLDVHLQRLLQRKTYTGLQSYVKAAANDESDVLPHLIRRIAQEYLLNIAIKFDKRWLYEEKRSYWLEDLSRDEKALYLELAGHTFFDYLAKNKVADLNLQLPADFKASLFADVLVIQFMTEDRLPMTQSLKIDQQACMQTFADLVSQSTKLQGFTYNIDAPVQTAQDLWMHLSKHASMAQQETERQSVEEQSWGCCIA